MATPTPRAGDVQRKFEQADFRVTQKTGELEVSKDGCKYRLKPSGKGDWLPAAPATFTVRGLDCELEDRGYQKFWLAGGKRFPIRLNDLRALQRFDQEVRYILNLKSLYGESLGTVCARSQYDRLTGRADA
jgi:hypothetical protein